MSFCVFCVLSRREELNSVYHVSVALQFLDHPASSEFPDYNLRILARAGQKLVAPAHIHVSNVVEVTVEGGLEG